MTVIVIGGGITGLAAAHALGKAGVPTTLLEASDRLGGKVRTEVRDGVVIEHGPDSFVSYRPAATRLAAELGIADRIIRPTEPRVVFIRSRGRFMRFPEGMGLVLPTKFRPFVTSDLFSWAEKLRMGLDLVLPRDRTEGDIGVGPFLRRRLGDAIVDRLAGPLIGGVYGTAIDELSLDAVVPQLRASEHEHRSLLLATVADVRARSKAARAAPSGSQPKQAPAPFVTMAGGTGELVDALVAAIRDLRSVDVRTDANVRTVAVHAGRAQVTLAPDIRLVADAVIVATPAAVASRLVADVAPDASRLLGAIPHGSTAVVNLAYPADRVPARVVGHGFLVADDEPLAISACTLSSNKWAGRAPEGTLLVRAFIGSMRGDAHRLADGDLVAAARADIERTLGIRGEPTLARLARYPDAMPHYTVGHLGRVAAAEASLASFPALRIAGGAYRGVGLPDCIAQGQAAAEAVVGVLSGRADRRVEKMPNGLPAESVVAHPAA